MKLRLGLFFGKIKKIKLIFNVIMNFNIKLTIFQRKLTNFNKEILHNEKVFAQNEVSN